MVKQLKCPVCNNSLENNIIIVDHEWDEFLIKPNRTFDFGRMKEANKTIEYMELQCWTCPDCRYMD
jgi:hypothetical protein